MHHANIDSTHGCRLAEACPAIVVGGISSLSQFKLADQRQSSNTHRLGGRLDCDPGPDRQGPARALLQSQPGWQVWAIEPIVKLRLVHNSGFVFGLFSDSAPAWLVSLVVIAAIGAIALVFTRQIDSPSLPTRIVFGLTFGGAIGNLIDRFRLGYVIDYVDFGWWPVFNIADSAINISIVAFIVLLLLGRVETRSTTPSPFME